MRKLTLRLEEGKEVEKSRGIILRGGLGFQADAEETQNKRPRKGDISFVKSTTYLPSSSIPQSDDKKDATDPMNDQLAEFMAEINSLDGVIEKKEDEEEEDEVVKNKKPGDDNDLDKENKKDTKLALKSKNNNNINNNNNSNYNDEAIMDKNDNTVSTNNILKVNLQDEIVFPPKPQKPIAPQSNWQAVLDDTHQCYYYWNAKTSKSVWEIPKEYENFLEAYRQFESRMGKYELEFQAWKCQYEEIKKKSEEKKTEKEINQNTNNNNDNKDKYNNNNKHTNNNIDDKNVNNSNNNKINLVNYSLWDDEPDNEENYEDNSNNNNEENNNNNNEDNNNNNNKELNKEENNINKNKKNRKRKMEEVKEESNKRFKLNFEAFGNEEENLLKTKMDKLRFLTSTIDSCSRTLSHETPMSLLEAVVASKTRMEDWRQGRLDINYLLQKLQEAVEIVVACQDQCVAGVVASGGEDVGVKGDDVEKGLIDEKDGNDDVLDDKKSCGLDGVGEEVDKLLEEIGEIAGGVVVKKKVREIGEGVEGEDCGIGCTENGVYCVMSLSELCQLKKNKVEEKINEKNITSLQLKHHQLQLIQQQPQLNENEHDEETELDVRTENQRTQSIIGPILPPQLLQNQPQQPQPQQSQLQQHPQPQQSQLQQQSQPQQSQYLKATGLNLTSYDSDDGEEEEEAGEVGNDDDDNSATNSASELNNNTCLDILIATTTITTTVDPFTTTTTSDPTLFVANNSFVNALSSKPIATATFETTTSSAVTTFNTTPTFVTTTSNTTPTTTSTSNLTSHFHQNPRNDVDDEEEDGEIGDDDDDVNDDDDTEVDDDDLNDDDKKRGVVGNNYVSDKVITGDKQVYNNDGMSENGDDKDVGGDKVNDNGGDDGEKGDDDDTCGEEKEEVVIPVVKKNKTIKKCGLTVTKLTMKKKKMDTMVKKWNKIRQDQTH